MMMMTMLMITMEKLVFWKQKEMEYLSRNQLQPLRQLASKSENFGTGIKISIREQHIAASSTFFSRYKFKWPWILVGVRLNFNAAAAAAEAAIGAATATTTAAAVVICYPNLRFPVGQN